MSPNMQAIGGYFELELSGNGEAYHSRALALNTGRNALEYALRTRPTVRKILLPHYICDTVLEPVQRLQLEVAWYAIDSNLDPVLHESPSPDVVLVYVNYFGIKQNTVRQLAAAWKTQLIVDSTQAFFDKALPGIDTFYSPRKFFGVPDGGYLYSERELEGELETDRSAVRFSHLVKRWDDGPEAGYADFKRANASLSGQPIRAMSLVTEAILRGINYNKAATRRRKNFNLLHSHLGHFNLLQGIISGAADATPMLYPLWIPDGLRLKEHLIGKRIFTPTYWPKIQERLAAEASTERRLLDDLVCLPVDGRYGEEAMTHVSRTVLDWMATEAPQMDFSHVDS